MPKITILLPTYQSGKYLSQTLDSIRRQTFKDFEILVIDDNSTDNTLSILHNAKDLNIRVMNGRGNGLADALNLGICNADGEYIARIDADDIMTETRLEKQVNYLDSHKEVIVCGGWQQYFGNSSYLHAPPSEPAQCRANLIFRCDLCHSTLMLRKDAFIKHQLFYDGNYAAEDFELWTRVLRFGEIANIPEIFAYYRYNGQNITAGKMDKLIKQNGEIVAKTLKDTLNIHLTDEQKMYFTAWSNPFYQDELFQDHQSRKHGFEDLKNLLLNIDEANEKWKVYERSALYKILWAEWLRLRYNIVYFMPKEDVRREEIGEEISKIKYIELKIKGICTNYPGMSRKIKKINTMIKNRIRKE